MARTQKNAEREKDWHEKSQDVITLRSFHKLDSSGVALLGLIVAVIAAAIYFYQLDTMRRQVAIMEADMRPYVGLQKISVEGINPNNQQVVLGILKNFGHSPAIQAVVDWEVMVNGVPRPDINAPRKPLTLFPGADNAIQIGVTSEHWQKIVSGDDTLQVRVKVSYRDVSEQKQYEYCEQQRFYPANGVFLSEGC